MERNTQWSQEGIPQIKLPDNWQNIVKFIIPLLIVIWLLSGIYIVAPNEQGVERIFGKASDITEPGPHYCPPWPIGMVNKPKVKEVRRLEVGFRTISSGSPARYRFHPEESLMLTGDEQIIDAQIIVQYKIKRPIDYLFNVKKLEGPHGTLMDAAEVSLRHVVGQRPIDDVLIKEKLQVEIDIRSMLQDIMNAYESGIDIVEVKLQTVQPPKQVAAAFSDVVSAKEDRERAIKEAEGYKEDIIPKARGKARSVILNAEGYKAEKVKRAQGDAERFLVTLREYKKAKEVTRKRLYLEALEDVLPGIKKFIISAEKGSSPVQLLPLEGNLLNGRSSGKK